jgi:hypothetical protein
VFRVGLAKADPQKIPQRKGIPENTDFEVAFNQTQVAYRLAESRARGREK